MTKIDWTKPLELTDGTPVKLDPGHLNNPDSRGDYYLVRSDGLGFTEGQTRGAGDVLIAQPDGTEWFHGGPQRVRNTAVPTFDPTKPVQTRDGRKARILSTEGPGEKPLVVALQRTDRAGEVLVSRYADGHVSRAGREMPHDLINVPERTHAYRSIQPDGALGPKALSKLAAQGSHAMPYTGPVLKLTFEDGRPVAAEIV
ncbi:hypothetical protein QQS45_08305 [Alteriqipengyuania flavescens]|uniref:hypothetical protein n=1 Tax=Alteriqipengyuania flavescens TaxID=3053610 RepID=UPI0025B39BE9|nr:hypothetical protein [Alteriqipengyuania flavescens]WJY17649.1 hypothetical protein QQW98_08300 [Alteriqipengyuania flavescens]WJY23592.1 hypothetical protein QQS45_08305 [Alteriqipengyuania flavescens]